MIESWIQIEGGEVMDFYRSYGFIYMDADERTAPPEKATPASSYAEEPGEHPDKRAVEDAFDYKAKFLIEAPNKDLTNVNSKIAAFNAAIRETVAGSNVKRCREVSFYNLLNRVKITGVPSPISEPTEVYHSNRYGEMDFAIVELRIRVSDPRKCDFEFRDNGLRPDEIVDISLEAHGLDIEVKLSRPLKEDEHVVLLRRGAAKKGANMINITNKKLGGNVKRKNRWQVYYKYIDSWNNSVYGYWPFYLDDNGILKHRFKDIKSLYCWKDFYNHWQIFKSHGSRGYLKKTHGVTYGVAVYKTINNYNEKFKRVSNVCYFRSMFNSQTHETEIRT